MKATSLSVADSIRHSRQRLAERSYIATPPRGSFQTGSAQALTFANVEHEGIGFAGVDDGTIQIVS